MKHIIKNASPIELETYKQTPGVCYKHMFKEVKDAVKTSLLKEQGYICCFCGKRIEKDNSTIDHIKPQGTEEYKHLQLDYNNMICSCNGIDSKEGKREKNKQTPTHCNNKKDDKPIKISPLDLDCESRFEFDDDGNINGIDQDAIDTITVLGLGCPTLNTDRKAAIQPYMEEYQGESVSKDVLEALILKLKQKRNDGRFVPFCFVSIYYIKNYLLPLAK